MRTILYETLAALGQRADFRRVQAMGVGLGRLIWFAAPSRRRLAATTIQERLGLDTSLAYAVARDSFLHNGRSFLEILLCRKVDWRFIRERVIIDDPDYFREIVQGMGGRPYVTVTAHLGGWELFGGLLHLLTPQKQKQVIVKATHDQQLYSVIRRMRSQPTVQVVEHEQAAPKVLRNLKQNCLSGFLVDHNCRREEAIFLPFLGREAAVNFGPALLALRAKALVWPVFLVREDTEKYRLLFDTPLDTQDVPGGRHEKVEAIARFYTQAVERVVRRYPEQWFWMHRRWKTRPEGETSERG